MADTEHHDQQLEQSAVDNRADAAGEREGPIAETRVPDRQRFSLDGLRAAIFDLDGVLTDTAALHRRAWEETFNAFFDSFAAEVARFTEDDYLRLVDGRLRLDGARAVVQDRRLDVPEGGPEDAAGARTVAGIAAAKDERFRALLVSDGPSPYRSSIEFLRYLRDSGLHIAVATASLHGKEVLHLAGIENDVDAVVDGHSAAAMDLPGKPAPDTFVEAATRLGCSARECVVIDDALSGVVAATNGGFQVIALDRFDRRRELIGVGAHYVVADLAELEIAGDMPREDPYLLVEPDANDAREGVRESLFTLGNGYLATRGARPYARDDGVHYPGTYIAGVYNRLHCLIDDRDVDEEAIVNVPNWLTFSLSVENGPWLGDEDLTIVSRGLALDMKRGLLERRFAVIDGAGRRTSVLERRLVSMADPHLVATELSITAENWSGHLDLRGGLDGSVTDAETIEERLLGHRHLELIEAGEDDPDVSYLVVRTVQSKIIVAEALRARLDGTSGASIHEQIDAHVARTFSAEMTEGERITCEKVVSLYTSRDFAISDPVEAARDAARRSGGFAELLAAHQTAWSRIWARAAIEVHDGSIEAQRLINLHMFHVLQVASPHVVDRDVGLGARGLHGEGYLGHVFWDELFVLPILNTRFPLVARSLLAYRTRRLEAARIAARDEGHRGAMFPWQSASDGRDETPVLLFNPLSARWMTDRSRYQHHVGLAVAYNFWQHFQTTGDVGQLFETGAEVILEVARFFADLSTFDKDHGKYRIRGVMGPDEFHDGYPWSREPGIDDNAYTNVMTAWLLQRAIELVDLSRRSGQDETLERIGFDADELTRFEEISHALYVPFIGDVLAQFEGYERLEPIDLDAYRARYGDIGRLDLILDSEGDTVRRYQVGKQPDALMLLYLFSAEELRSVLGHLGYRFEADAIRETIDFYSSRVTHGSSLSRIVHAWINARLDRPSSWRFLSEALSGDVLDVNRGSTREGVHLGAMAGTIDIFDRCYTGLETRADALWLNPSLPEELESLSFRPNYRGHLLAINITHRSVEVISPSGPAGPVTLLLRGQPYSLQAGDRIQHEIAS